MAIYVLLCGAIILAGCAQVTTPPGASTATTAPPIPREFRAAWIATVANIDWPSKKGLTVEQQKIEIIRIVDRAKELNLNALIFQVRPAADALYPSLLEPWSEYLSGEQGKAPEPFYDPLKMWVEESHKRGIELHAWFNPYRARHTSAKSTNALTHIANTKPEVVKSYSGYLWMDPGEAAAAQRTLDVIVDVVRRYDIDGVHIDDYFYPYPVPVNAGVPATENSPEIDFPDEPSWSRYLIDGGKLNRADWRRQNVNALIERIHADVHREKPWMKFGISPFGLGRPDRRPSGIIGFSQYDKLYADVELWLEKGWLDYLAPQLYWPIDQPAQAFIPLMHYWARQNSSGRHIWPGLFTSRIDSSAKSWKVEEIVRQITLTRNDAAIGGHIHFSMVALLENRRAINDALKVTYASPALVPPMPWLESIAPPAPRVWQGSREPRLTIMVDSQGGDPSWQLAIWLRYGNTWRFQSVPVNPNGNSRAGFEKRVEGLPDYAVVSTVNRVGKESPRVSIALVADAIKVSE